MLDKLFRDVVAGETFSETTGAELLNWLEGAFDSVVIWIDGASQHALEVLFGFTSRLLRFLAHTLFVVVEIAWALAKTLVSLLAPAYVGSLGHEMTLMSKSLVFQVYGWTLLVVGGFITLLVLVGFVMALLGGVMEPGRHERRRAWAPILLNLTILAMIMMATHNGRQFSSPLLVFTQEVCHHVSADLQAL